MILTKFSPRVLPPDEIKLIAESMIGPISWESSGFESLRGYLWGHVEGGDS